MKITNFSDLLIAAKGEKTPQRFLFLFAKAVSLKNALKANHSSGTISPIMCVDKLPDEITTYNELLNEADGINKDWNFVLIGCLDATSDVDFHLNKMSNDVASGSDLSRYVILDREERPIIVA